MCYVWYFLSFQITSDTILLFEVKKNVLKWNKNLYRYYICFGQKCSTTLHHHPSECDFIPRKSRSHGSTKRIFAQMKSQRHGNAKFPSEDHRFRTFWIWIRTYCWKCSNISLFKVNYISFMVHCDCNLEI